MPRIKMTSNDALIQFRVTTEERDKLIKLAQERNLTLTDMLRQHVRLLLLKVAA